MATSPFLLGPYAPIYGERSIHQLEVSGTLPEQLSGLFTQIGPNPIRPPRRRDVQRYSWFSQDGLVCGVRLRHGRAEWFRNRWIRSRTVSRALGERRPPGPRHFPNDTVHTNIICSGQMLLALVETGCVPVRLDTALNTVEYTDLNGALPRGFSAHPKLDPVSGQLLTVAYSPLRTWAEYLVLNPDGSHTRDRIPLGGRPMLHDIAITTGHVLIFDLPVRFTFPTALRGKFPYRWDERHTARIGVLPREGGAPRWFEVLPGFIFHTISAHEQDGHIHVQAIRYERLFADDTEDPFSQAGHLWEWDIDLAGGRVTERQLDDRAQELPRIDPRRIGQPARYYYAISAEGEQALTSHQPDALVKQDLTTGEALIRRHDRYAVPAEAVFVPRGVAEDDGWVLHWLYDARRDASDLVVLNATDFTGDPVAVVHLPVRVPIGFHSSWFSEAELLAVEAGLP
ncbi:carotenoid oxygenase family protein [Amycolatopsis sp. NPDC051071]|uniref:carotenoid oxygenase family protein n=1 Tax=Amycolatopsis sp. NPDC051071 TaxID=3154637 RepID=UPI0034281C06